jgi:hypothetical protein
MDQIAATLPKRQPAKWKKEGLIPLPIVLAHRATLILSSAKRATVSRGKARR